MFLFAWLTWSGSGPPYTQAVANIRLVGVILAHFILFLNVIMQNLNDGASAFNV